MVLPGQAAVLAKGADRLGYILNGIQWKKHCAFISGCWESSVFNQHMKMQKMKMEDGRWKMEDGRWKMEDGI